jgi:D-amino-acid dehydrogenase
MKIAVTSAEIGGSATARHRNSVIHERFPVSEHLIQAPPCNGAHPMPPDGPPVLGRSGIEDAWLDLGRGTTSWAPSCGLHRVIANALAAHPAAIDISGPGAKRLGT